MSALQDFLVEGFLLRACRLEVHCRQYRFATLGGIGADQHDRAFGGLQQVPFGVAEGQARAVGFIVHRHEDLTRIDSVGHGQNGLLPLLAPAHFNLVLQAAFGQRVADDFVEPVGAAVEALVVGIGIDAGAVGRHQYVEPWRFAALGCCHDRSLKGDRCVIVGINDDQNGFAFGHCTTSPMMSWKWS